MKKNIQTKLWILAGLAVWGFGGSAIATPLGTLNVANCSGGGVTVTATTITWLPSAGTGVGCIDTGLGTSLGYSGGTLGAGVTGAIKNLTLGGGSVDQFMTFTATPLDFVLDGLGPGSANDCASVPINGTCSFAGSPFVFTNLGTSTGISLSAFGTANDGTPGSSNWNGAFTTQINQTIAQIQATISGGGSITSTHSASFIVTTVPEPATLSFMGLGLLGLGLIGRRKRKV